MSPSAPRQNSLVDHLLRYGNDWGQVYRETWALWFAAPAGSIEERWYAAIVNELCLRGTLTALTLVDCTIQPVRGESTENPGHMLASRLPHPIRRPQNPINPNFPVQGCQISVLLFIPSVRPSLKKPKLGSTHADIPYTILEAVLAGLPQVSPSGPHHRPFASSLHSCLSTSRCLYCELLRKKVVAVDGRTANQKTHRREYFTPGRKGVTMNRTSIIFLGFSLIPCLGIPNPGCLVVNPRFTITIVMRQTVGQVDLLGKLS